MLIYTSRNGASALQRESERAKAVRPGKEKVSLERPDSSLSVSKGVVQESQNCGSWKGPQEIIVYNPPAKAGTLQ